MIQLNLLPDVKKEFLQAESARRKTIAISILVTLIAVGATVAFAIYVYAVQNVILVVQTNDIKSKASDLNNIKDINKYLVIQNQLNALSALHADKDNFSRLLDILPRLNPAPPKNLTLSSLDVSAEEKTITFKGRVNDYGALTTFKDTLTNAVFTYQADGKQADATDLFTNVQIASASYQSAGSTSGVNFTVIATYDPAAFSQKNVGVTVTIPNIETTQSVVGSPQAIFGGNPNAN